MNDYYQLAGKYFLQFEGRKYFPGLKSVHWYLWLISLCAFIFYAYQVFIAAPKDDLPYLEMAGTEVAFLLSCILIALHRFKEAVRYNCTPSDLKPIDSLHEAKRKKLEGLLFCPATQFIKVSEEIIELRTLEKTFRSPLDPDLGEAWKKAFDKDSKARIMSVVMSIIGLIVGLIGKSDNTTLLKILSDGSTQKLLVGVTALVVSVLFLAITTFILVRQLLEVLSWLASASLPNMQNNATTLNYLIRDLIKYYKPAPRVPTPPLEPIQSSVSQPEAPKESKNSNSFLLATLAVQTAYTAWQCTKRKPPQ